MKHGSLFSGIGGFDLAAEWAGWENVFHCEIDSYCRTKLTKKYPNAESFGDITKQNFSDWKNKIDVLTGGFPCQDASNAKQNERPQGINGHRTGLIYHMLRAISEIRPLFVVAENVSNILKVNKGSDWGIILNELAGMGYDAEWRVLYASDEGAPHKRARCYLVAYSNGLRLLPRESFLSNVRKKVEPRHRIVAGTIIQAWGYWDSEPPAICLDDGISRSMVRKQLKAYGNAIVPQVAYQIFKAINEYNKNQK